MKSLFMKEKNGFKTYETVVVQSHNGYDLAGTHYDPAEYMPRDSQWGDAGWSDTDLESALKRYNNLTIS